MSLDDRNLAFLLAVRGCGADRGTLIKFHPRGAELVKITETPAAGLAALQWRELPDLEKRLQFPVLYESGRVDSGTREQGPLQYYIRRRELDSWLRGRNSQIPMPPPWSTLRQLNTTRLHEILVNIGLAFAGVGARGAQHGTVDSWLAPLGPTLVSRVIDEYYNLSRGVSSSTLVPAARDAFSNISKQATGTRLAASLGKRALASIFSKLSIRDRIALKRGSGTDIFITLEAEHSIELNDADVAKLEEIIKFIVSRSEPRRQSEAS